MCMLQEESELDFGADPMLWYYLEEGQPDFTSRLVHGQPPAEETRLQGLRSTVKSIESILGSPDSKQLSNFAEVINTIVPVDETTAVNETQSKEG